MLFAWLFCYLASQELPCMVHMCLCMRTFLSAMCRTRCSPGSVIYSPSLSSLSLRLQEHPRVGYVSYKCITLAQDSCRLTFPTLRSKTLTTEATCQPSIAICVSGHSFPLSFLQVQGQHIADRVSASITVS